MKKQLLILLVSVFLMTCSTNHVSEGFSGMSIKLSPQKSKKIQPQDLFAKINFISLEVTNQSLLDVICKISVDTGLLFIQNCNTSSLVSFDLSGKFLNRIGLKGQGPGELQYPGCFALNKKEKEVWIVDNDEKINKYNYFGEYKESVDANLFFWDMLIPGNDFVYYYTSKRTNYEKNTNVPICYELLIKNMQTNKTNTYFPYDYETYPTGRSYFQSMPAFSHIGNSATFHYVYSDTIYAIYNDSVIPKYIVDFGNKKIKGDLSKLSTEEIKETIFINQKNKAGLIMNVVESDDVLMFTYWLNNEYYHAFYNKKTQYIIEGILPSIYGAKIIFLTSYNDELIGYFNPHEIDLSVADENWNLSLRNKKILEDITMDNNPILIKCSFKKF